MSNKPSRPPAEPAAQPAPAPAAAPQVPEEEVNPSAGGCYIRDPATGQVAPADAPAAPAATE